MRHLNRPVLNGHSKKYYDKWSQAIALQPDRKTRAKESERLWKQARGRSAVARAVVQLHEMNDQLPWCMYCEHNEATLVDNGRVSTIIDHWEPRERSPLRTFDWENHILACEPCNTRRKGSKFPKYGGSPLLLHPVDDDPMMHLKYVPSNGEFRPKKRSGKGRVTIRLFDLHRFDDDRKDIWDLIIAGLQGYDRALSKGDVAYADKVKERILKRSHRSVLYYLVDIALGPSGTILTAPGIPDIVRRHNVGSWR